MFTLGINAAYHDPAACLVRDGQVIAAAEEERFTHVKHGKRPIPFSTYELPFHAIVCTPRDAVECFWTSPLDALVIGSFVLEKSWGNV